MSSVIMRFCIVMYSCFRVGVLCVAIYFKLFIRYIHTLVLLDVHSYSLTCILMVELPELNIQLQKHAFRAKQCSKLSRYACAQDACQGVRVYLFATGK
jgi:hypothetical protein